MIYSISYMDVCGKDYSKMIVQDRRVKRTQQALMDALVHLTLEKGYSAMTIRDITERANVGYATFFRHYADKNALLHDVLASVFAELIQVLPIPSPSTSFELGEPLFRYVQQHEQIVRVLLNSGESSFLVESVVEMSSEHARQHDYPEDGCVPLEVALYHIVNSTVALITWWLDHDMPYSPERMGKIYHALIEEPGVLPAIQ
jgi:AcrR family transcriptional regulator